MIKKILDNKARLYDILTTTEELNDEIDLQVEEGSLYSQYPSNLVFARRTLDAMSKLHTTETTTVPPAVAAPDASESDVSSSDEGNPPKKEKRVASLSPKKLLIGVVAVILIGAAAGAGYVYYYLPKATVVLSVTQSPLEHSAEVVVDTKASDILGDESVIPGESVSVDVEETAKFNATGKKEVGERASGVVEVKNFTESSIRLGVGSFLSITVDGKAYQFTTKSEITIPRSTETKPNANTRVNEAGVSEVSIVAEDIGPSYNLSAGKVFTVETLDTDDIFATNPSPLTGGTVEEVAIISEEDVKTATQQLTDALQVKAKDSLKASITEDQSFDDRVVTLSTKSISFSHEVGAAAKEFSGTMRMSAQTIVYEEDALKGFLKKDIRSNVPDGYVLSETDEVLQVEKVEQIDDETLKVQAKISSMAIPTFDEVEIKASLIGHSLEDGESYLRDLTDVQGYDIRLWPTLPGPLKHFPHMIDRLTLEIVPSDEVNTQE